MLENSQNDHILFKNVPLLASNLKIPFALGIELTIPTKK